MGGDFYYLWFHIIITMETLQIVNTRAKVKEEFIAILEDKIHKEFLTDWAMGWMMDVAIDIAISKKQVDENMFENVFLLWRQKSLELADLVLTHDNDESHLYGGLDLTRMSPEVCQRWRTRFAQLSAELGIK